ncbi:hypothetical protein M4D81_27990 [Paenibacillus sp. p3-SID867]|uniref:hypothetical protein n=1 Tax=Paenibacillus sp. p3-SID867 TaxID=2916363 RepID=UPI0021A691AE|nr:hypothetical protein [Paenibacillus sp. p3-SID867]MCT1402840.1 hypothetical protein [Paenibacillus sp. p3-SID867]
MSETNNTMNQKGLEEFEEIKIRLLMTRFTEVEGKKLIEENEELSKDPFYLPSEKQKQTFTKRIRLQFLLFDIKTFFQLLIPIRSFKLTVILPVIIALLLTTFFSVGAFRTSILNLFVEVEREFTAIRLGENGVCQYSCRD